MLTNTHENGGLGYNPPFYAVIYSLYLRVENGFYFLQLCCSESCIF